LKQDEAGRRNFEWAQAQRFILREERTFLEPVEATIPAFTLNPRTGSD
jgi:hypothetical protein